MVNLSLILITLILLSCGKKIEENDLSRQAEEVGGEGVYSAVLFTVNPSISLDISGEIRITRYGDDIRVSSRVRNGPRLKLQQGLHTGTNCPTLNLDTDRDGRVSFHEALPMAGYIVVPLDGDLSSQLRGQELRLGSRFDYQRSASYSLLLSDLRQPDDVVNDEIAKLPEGELVLERRVVTVYTTLSGVAYPVACGILAKVSENPDDEWEPLPEDNTGHDRIPRRRPRPVPEPGPDPTPPEIEPPDDSSSWWDRVRQRWRRWRDRWRDTT